MHRIVACVLKSSIYSYSASRLFLNLLIIVSSLFLFSLTLNWGFNILKKNEFKEILKHSHNICTIKKNFSPWSVFQSDNAKIQDTKQDMGYIMLKKGSVKAQVLLLLQEQLGAPSE